MCYEAERTKDPPVVFWYTFIIPSHSALWNVEPSLIPLHEQIFAVTLIIPITFLRTLFRQSLAFWGWPQFCSPWHVRGTSDAVRSSWLSSREDHWSYNAENPLKKDINDVPLMLGEVFPCTTSQKARTLQHLVALGYGGWCQNEDIGGVLTCQQLDAGEEIFLPSCKPHAETNSSSLHFQESQFYFYF